MSRVLLLVLAVLVFFWLVRRALSGRNAHGKSADRSGPADGQGGKEATPDLVACAQCGVLVPKNEALADEAASPPLSRFFCCEEHRRQGSL